MKIFLLFLFVSFILGIQYQEATLQRQRWTMVGIAVLTGLSYFFFDGFI